MKLSLFTAPLFLGIAGASTAAAELYECKFKQDGVIAPLIYVEEAGDKIQVLDGLIKDVYGGEINGKVSVRNDKRVTYAWKVKGLKGTSDGHQGKVMPTLVYRLTRKLGSNGASISAKAVGFKNTYRSTGSCKIKK